MQKFKKTVTAEEDRKGINLTGKTILITGCKSGLVFETMRVLTLRGAKILGISRKKRKSRALLGSRMIRFPWSVTYLNQAVFKN